MSLPFPSSMPIKVQMPNHDFVIFLDFACSKFLWFSGWQFTVMAFASPFSAYFLTSKFLPCALKKKKVLSMWTIYAFSFIYNLKSTLVLVSVDITWSQVLKILDKLDRPGQLVAMYNNVRLGLICLLHDSQYIHSNETRNYSYYMSWNLYFTDLRCVY